jgi:dihydrofolate reductase
MRQGATEVASRVAGIRGGSEPPQGLKCTVPGFVSPDMSSVRRPHGRETRVDRPFPKRGCVAPRRIVTFTWVTADGYFAAADGNLDWVVPDEAQAKTATKDIVTFDTVLFGRRTYQIFEGFWRHAVVDDVGTVEDPHHPGRRSAEHGAIAMALNTMTKLVFSRTLTDLNWNNSRVLHECDPRELDSIKRQPGKDMIIFGSGSIVSQLTQHGLIDEYQFAVCPVLLGTGQPLIQGVSQRLGLDLLEAKRLPSGDVMLRYVRSKPVSS